MPNSIPVLFYDEGASFLPRVKRLHLKMASKIPLGVLILPVIFALLREILRKKKPKTKQKSKTKIAHTKQQQKPHNKQTKKRSQKTYLELLTVLQISHWLFMETHVCLYTQAHEDTVCALCPLTTQDPCHVIISRMTYWLTTLLFLPHQK